MSTQTELGKYEPRKPAADPTALLVHIIEHEQISTCQQAHEIRARHDVRTFADADSRIPEVLDQ